MEATKGESVEVFIDHKVAYVGVESILLHNLRVLVPRGCAEAALQGS